MTDENNPNQNTAKRVQEFYSENSKLEAHLIADMLRIESITSEIREFKQDTKSRFDKLEGWIIGIVGVSVATLLASVGALLTKLMG